MSLSTLDVYTTSMPYISLVLGNEPAELLALLSVVNKLLVARHDERSTNLHLLSLRQS